MKNELLVVKYSGLKIGELEVAHALKILLILRLEGPTARSVLYSMVTSSNRTMMDRVNELIELELVEDVPITKPPYRALALTKKGNDIAGHIEAIEKAMGH
jgi:DNA-binding HxlR family transcriptional regulator